MVLCPNSDVVCPYPMKDMLDFHTARGAEATILVTKVDDPSKYGECVCWACAARDTPGVCCGPRGSIKSEREYSYDRGGSRTSSERVEEGAGEGRRTLLRHLGSCVMVGRRC